MKKIKGYANILLTPFMAMPHTCHSIKVNMVFQEVSKNIVKELSAVLEIDLYFLFGFSSKLQISPINAHIKHNTSSVGLMNPCVIMTTNNQRKKSLMVNQGGIHPNWIINAEK